MQRRSVSGRRVIKVEAQRQEESDGMVVSHGAGRRTDLGGI